MHPLLPIPTFAQVTRPSSRRTPISRTSLQGISTSTSAQKKRGAPDCFFCWILPGFRFSQAGEWQRIKDESEVLRRDTTRPNPRLRDQPFDFHVTASLLGTIATAFCRGGQLERPGDVICGGNRRISAVQAPSSSAHPFARSLSVSHVKVCDVHDASLRCGQSGQSRKIPMHRGRGDGADRPTLHSIEGWKKNQQRKPLRCHVGPRMQSECRECMSVSVCAPKKKRLCVSWGRCAGAAVTAPRATRRDSSGLFFRTLSKPTCAGLSSSSRPRRRLTPVVPLSARTPSPEPP